MKNSSAARQGGKNLVHRSVDIIRFGVNLVVPRIRLCQVCLVALLVSAQGPAQALEFASAHQVTQGRQLRLGDQLASRESFFFERENAVADFRAQAGQGVIPALPSASKEPRDNASGKTNHTRDDGVAEKVVNPRYGWKVHLMIFLYALLAGLLFPPAIGVFLMRLCQDWKTSAREWLAKSKV
jgi:hypothetical protein